MALKFNPISGNFDFTGLTGTVYPEVNTYADLSNVIPSTGVIYLVKTTTGIWPFRKTAGLYRYNGSGWTALPSTMTIGELADVSLTSIDNNHTLQYDLVNGGWINTNRYRFGSATNYAEFESDGTLKFVGDATTWDDVYPSSVTIGSGGTAPSFTAYNGNLRAYEFVGTGATSRELNLGFQIPHDYMEGSNIEPHLHLYIPNDVTGGNIRFYCEYTWENVNSTGAVTPITLQGSIVRTSNQGIGNNAVLTFGEVVGTGKTISSVFMCRLYRNPADAADTFAASVWLKSADLHIQEDTAGSRQPYIK